MTVEQTDLSLLPRARADVAGHFGEWLQGRLGPSGPVVLVTLRCAALSARVLRHEDGPLRLDQPVPVLSPDQVAGLAARLGLRSARYSLELSMPPGGGAGASTAALVALARAGGAQDEALLPEACLAIEGASDPLMLPQPDGVLWASRAGQVAAVLPPVPHAEILGGFFGAPQRTEARDQAFPDISDLVAAWQDGPDLAEAARLASASARRTTEARGPTDDPTEALATRFGALGWVRAHTGSARGLIFAPGTVPPEAAEALRAAGASGVMRFETGGAAPLKPVKPAPQTRKRRRR